ncbi:MAG: hypothetical protein AABZ77_07435 [Chloroflexota bacterium]
MQVVKTDSGCISGTVLGKPDKPVHVYRRIPYAAPPAVKAATAAGPPVVIHGWGR